MSASGSGGSADAPTATTMKSNSEIQLSDTKDTNTGKSSAVEKWPLNETVPDIFKLDAVETTISKRSDRATFVNNMAYTTAVSAVTANALLQILHRADIVKRRRVGLTRPSKLSDQAPKVSESHDNSSETTSSEDKELSHQTERQDILASYRQLSREGRLPPAANAAFGVGARGAKPSHGGSL